MPERPLAGVAPTALPFWSSRTWSPVISVTVSYAGAAGDAAPAVGVPAAAAGTVVKPVDMAAVNSSAPDQTEAWVNRLLRRDPSNVVPVCSWGCLQRAV